MNRNFKIVGSLILAICIIVILFLGFINPRKAIENIHQPTKKGLCWVAGDSIAKHNLDHIQAINANYISQTPFGWMDGHDSPKVVLNNNRAWWGETDKGIRHTAKLAKEAGVKSMLKPHIWLRRSGDKWRSDIAMNSKEEWTQWFESYSTFILHYAKLAESCQIESLCIGTELYQTTKQYPKEWRKIIRAIREVYNGELTYAANWYLEYEELSFWGDLDYIGIQAYFPLSDKEYPSRKSMIEGWESHIKAMKKLASKFNKQIVFTEIGYKNTVDSAKEPWTWPQDMDTTTVISEQMQMDCYAALFESVWHEPWFDGLFIWKWFHSTHAFEDYAEYAEMRIKRRAEWAKKRKRRYRPDVRFTPQGGEAMGVISEWYGE